MKRSRFRLPIALALTGIALTILSMLLWTLPFTISDPIVPLIFMAGATLIVAGAGLARYILY